MTKQQAKELSLEVWGYLRDHSYIADKSDLPQELYRKIYFLTSRCPLCEILLFSLEKCCSGCPLENCGAKSLWWE